MTGKVIVITGGSDGIGAAAARQLAAQGHQVIITGRSAAKTKAVADELQIPSYLADFSKLNEVRTLAARLKRDLPRIDVLVNNAGGVFGRRQLTADGHEMTFQVNHLAHFLLTELLMDRLIDSRASVLNTSSIAHRVLSDFDIDDLELAQGYSPERAYGNAKLANILFTRELHRRYHGQGISTAAFHPGYVGTGFAGSSTSPLRFVYHTPLKYLLLISPKKGADTLAWLAAGEPGKDWTSGGYYYKRKVIKALSKAYDPGLAAALWERSEAMVG